MWIFFYLAQSPKDVCDPAKECCWREPSNGVAKANKKINQLQCADGSFCIGDGSDYGSDSWKCCNGKKSADGKLEGRIRCPSNHPNLCVNKECAGKTARCCEKDCNEPGKNYGGNLPCPKSKFKKMIKCLEILLIKHIYYT